MCEQWDNLPDDQRREFVEIIARQAKRLNELIDEVAAGLGNPRAEP